MLMPPALRGARTGRAGHGAQTVIPDVRKIAVLRSNSIGDFMFVLPALDALRRAYPQAEIVLLGKRWHRSFLARRPGPVDRVAVVPRVQGVNEEGLPGGTARFFRDMAAEKFDLAVQVHGGGRYSNPFIRRLQARVTIGLKAPDAPPLDRWVPYIYYHPEVLRYLEVVSLAGASPVTLEPRLRLAPDDLIEAERFFGVSGRPVAVLHPGGSDPRRHWTAKKFAAVGDALAGAGARIVITGTAAENDIAEAVRRCLRCPAENAAGRLSLNGLTGLLAKSRLVVSNDTGPLHLARAVGTPTVGLYWVGNLINAGPLSAARHRSHLSWRLNCPECGKNCIETDCPHSSSFVAEIPEDEVIASALELYSNA